MNAINLWEAMTALETSHRREPDAARGPRVTEEDLRELSQSARFGSGQELILQATPDGWVIKVLSCYSESPVDCGVEILIPKDSNLPVKVVRDAAGRKTFFHTVEYTKVSGVG